MIDETIVIDKIELLKRNSKEIMGKRYYLRQDQFEYILNKLIDYINKNKE